MKYHILSIPAFVVLAAGLITIPAQASLNGRLACGAMIPASCQHKQTCTVLFDDDKGAQEVTFPKAVKHLKVGDKVHMHGEEHTISRIDPMTHRFKLFEFNQHDME